MTVLVITVATTIAAMFAFILKSEYGWWGRGLANRLVNLAAAILPDDERPRGEEWRAELDAARLETGVTGLVLAVRVFLAAALRFRGRATLRAISHAPPIASPAPALARATIASAAYVAHSRLVDKKDRSTYGHSERVGILSAATAEKLGMRPDAIDQIRLGATLHDVGKIAIPDRILHKRGQLTDREWEVLKTHTEEGAAALSDLEILAAAALVVRSHHENFDGSGYPHGLAGEDIPIGGRIAHAADTYDCMTSVRDYRAWRKTPAEALNVLREGSGTRFDPGVVQALTEVVLERLV